MKRGILFVVLLIIANFGITPPAFATQDLKPWSPHNELNISGAVKNTKRQPVKDVAIEIFIDGKQIRTGEAIRSSNMGTFEAQLCLPPGLPSKGKVEIEMSKPCYKSSGRFRLASILKMKSTSRGGTLYLAHVNITLARAISPAFWIATAILVGVYVLIAFEFMHRTLAAFLGASLLLLISYTLGSFSSGYFILSFNDATKAIDMNVIFLLLAMMIMIGVLKKTGVFQWMAYKSYAVARGNIFILAFILMFSTGFMSAFLDNVTTMMLMFPVTLEIALTLKVNPIKIIVPEAFASNVGGTATLIGDPPNMMIGSHANLSFIEFIKHLSVVNVIGLIAAITYFAYWFRKDYLKSETVDFKASLDSLRNEYKISDRTLLIQGGTVLVITIVMFFVGALKTHPCVPALVGACVLMVISKIDIVEMLEHEIEWPTLIFFIMLFIVVAGAEQAGLIEVIADGVKEISRGSLVLAIVIVLWGSAFVSAFIDNIPFTATMLPVVGYLTAVIPGAENGVLWWALSLGACLGGNGTLIGASTNVVTAGLLERAGYPVSFRDYFKIAFIPMMITVAICMFWLLMVEMR